MNVRYIIAIVIAGLLGLGIRFYTLPQPVDPPASGLVSQQARKLDARNRYRGPGKYYEYHREIRTRNGADYPDYAYNYRRRELTKALRRNRRFARPRTDLPYTNRGPGNVGGRTRGLWVDPTDSTASTWLAGSVGGGIWKTEDAGQSWRHVTEEFTSLSTATLASSANNPQVIYAGTGEGFGQFITGDGMYKSTDQGENWSRLESTADDPRFANILRIVVNPADENELVICTRTSRNQRFQSGEPISYIFKSTDGGDSWTEQYNRRTPIQQIVFNPQNYRVQYASVNRDGIYKSTDAGASWRQVFDADGLPLGRMELAISPQDSNYIYFSAQHFDVDFALYRSEDAGDTWERVIRDNPSNSFGPVFNTQGWYDNTIAVHPYQKETVYVGGAGPILRIDLKSDSITSLRLPPPRNETDFVDFIETFGYDDGVVPLRDLENFFDIETNTQIADYTGIVLDFGKGDTTPTQLAHRFSIDPGTLEGAFEGIARVPFEVRDIRTGEQLAVSFHDANGDGEWQLKPGETASESEFLQFHALPYNDNLPNLPLTTNYTEKGLYFAFPRSNTEDTIQTTTPGGRISFLVDLLAGRAADMAPIVDSYRQYREFGVTSKGVHVDHHNLILLPRNDSLKQFYILNANDGGVAFSDDGGETFIQTGDTFKESVDFDGNRLTFETTAGYLTSQFYGVDKMNGGDRYIGGTQDNGTWLSDLDPGPDSEWDDAPSGDGFEAAWHYEDSLKILESSQFNNIFRTEDGGRSWTNVSPPGRGPFLTRIANSKQDPEVVYTVSERGVNRSVDFGLTWETTSMPGEWSFRNTIPLEVSLASPLVVWTGGRLTSSSRIAVSKDGGTTFESTADYPEATLGTVTNIATHPFDPATAYALFSIADGPKVLKTTDYGQSWEDISGFGANRKESTRGFPDVAVYSLLVMPFDTNQIWVGTDIGLVKTTDGGESWFLAEDGLPPVAVFEMTIVNDEVVMATHGRGVWSVALPELSGYEPIASIRLPRTEVDALSFGGSVLGRYQFRSPYDSVQLLGRIEYEDQTFETEAVTLRDIPEPMEGDFQLQFAELPNDTTLFEARVVTRVFVGEAIVEFGTNTLAFAAESNPLVGFYENDFDDERRDFASKGFVTGRDPGFEDNTLHTAHPYPDRDFQLSIFKKPIVIESGPTLLRFDEIVLVEDGASDDFGSVDFFDFVSVIAYPVKDINNPVTLAGYDSGERQEWLNAYLAERDGSPDLFAERVINLRSSFAAGDTVYLAFLLSADPFVNGWGWAIDNLEIGDRSTAVSAPSNSLQGISLNTYPNPVRDQAAIRLQLDERRRISLEVYNFSGRRVASIIDQTLPAGKQQFTFDAGRLASGAYVLVLRAGDGVMTQRFIVGGRK